MQGWRWLRERSKLAPMKRRVALLALALSACSGGDGPREYPGVRLKPAANPSAVIAAELAFAQLAQTKGQWTAFRETATQDAEMFVPQRVNALTWLKGKADPATAVKWQPHQVWASCDGSFTVTRGAWQGPKATGYFTTIWQRQKDGGYKWVLDQGDPLASPLSAPEMIAAKVADCSPPKLAIPLSPEPAESPAPNRKERFSLDGTLTYSTEVFANGSRQFVVKLWDGKAFDTVLDSSTAAQAN